jgi:AAA+ ATPase superfamily predicted ATPase
MIYPWGDFVFIGRESELSSLNKLYNEDNFQFAVIYGRRRVGKTTLITEFCKDKPNIFFVAEEYNDKIALENFSDKILTYFDMKDFVGRFETWEKAFLYLGKQAKNERLVVVIDEFPYIVNSNKGIPSLLQNLIDHNLKDTKLFLIVCGSSMSFIEKEVLSYKSPLYGRRTAQYIIDPFDFFDSSKFFPKYSLEDKVKSYGVLGGIPQYLLKFNDSMSIEDNIKEYILSKASYLHEEPKNLLKQELREPALYNSVIEAIAVGASKLNEIATRVGEDTDKCAKYIKTLLELRILKKESPAGEEGTSRKSIYKLQDNLFRFWYRFVFHNVSLVEQEMVDYIYSSII